MEKGQIKEERVEQNGDRYKRKGDKQRHRETRTMPDRAKRDRGKCRERGETKGSTHRQGHREITKDNEMGEEGRMINGTRSEKMGLKEERDEGSASSMQEDGEIH